MPECNLLNGGITKTCDNNVAGIRRIFLKEKSLITSVVHGSPSKKITALTISSGKFFPFEFGKRSGSTYTESTTTSDNGTTVTVQTITLILTRREQAKRDILLFLGKGKELVAIVEDSNGLFWYLGEYEGLELTESLGGPGTSKTDLNGYTLTLVAAGEPEEASELNSVVALASI